MAYLELLFQNQERHPPNDKSFGHLWTQQACLYHEERVVSACFQSNYVGFQLEHKYTHQKHYSGA